MKLIISPIIVLVLLSACASQPGYRTAASDSSRVATGNGLAAKATSEWFEAIRNRPTRLRAFLAEMPKGGDIHTHASGAVYAESYIEWSAKENRCVNMTTGYISNSNFTPCTDPESPISDLLSDPDGYGKLVNMLSMRHLAFAGKPGHDQFFEAFAKFSGGTRSNQIAELTNRAALQNISYAEIMLTVGSRLTKDTAREVGSYDGDLDSLYHKLAASLRPGLADGIQELDGYDNGTATLLGCNSTSPQPGCDVTRRYLLQVIRTVDPTRVYSQLIYAFEVARHSPIAVGLNMVAPEDNYVALRDYDLHMKMLEHLALIYPDVPVSLHAGELTMGLVQPQHLQDHIRKAVEVAGAKRIGHGVDIFYERNPQQLLESMDQRDVLVEICLSSNDLILGVKDEFHPVMDYLKAGVAVTLATDDEGISRIDLTNEYLRATLTYGLGYLDLKEMARNSLAYSFLAGERLWTATAASHVIDSCAHDELGSENPSTACQAFLDSSHKARLQWQLERDFNRFEGGY